MRLGRRAVLAAAGTFAFTPGARAQDFPRGPIRMVIAFPAGGPTDVVGRFVAHRMSELLGQQVVVENRSGASGNIGTASVAAAKPDGQTILFTASTTALVPALYGASLPYDAAKSLTAIAYVASMPLILVVPADGPKTTAELIARLRKEPGKYSYPSSGNGGMIHVASYLFAKQAGADVLHVPYRGSAPGMMDTIAGRHAFQIDTLGTSKGFLESGKLRVLAVGTEKRMPALPDVPTVEESADFPYAINTWYVAFAPAGTPAPIIDKLNAVMNQALKHPDMLVKSKELAIDWIESTPAQAQKFFDDQRAFWDPIVKESGAKVE